MWQNVKLQRSHVVKVFVLYIKKTKANARITYLTNLKNITLVVIITTSL